MLAIAPAKMLDAQSSRVSHEAMWALCTSEQLEGADSLFSPISYHLLVSLSYRAGTLRV